jgi:hypothetical protein
LQVFADLDDEIEMHTLCRRSIRGGVVQSGSIRYAQANNRYLANSMYDPFKPSSFLWDIDATSNYGGAMRQFLPTGNFKMESSSQFDANAAGKICELPAEGARGYVFCVDLEVPYELHDYFNDYPLAPEKQRVVENMLSPHQLQCRTRYDLKGSSPEKLLCTLEPKTKYTVHYRLLQLYLKLGLRITKIHQVFSFDQSPWLRPYIDHCVAKRKAAMTPFEKDYWKLAMNATKCRQVLSI